MHKSLALQEVNALINAIVVRRKEIQSRRHPSLSSSLELERLADFHWQCQNLRNTLVHTHEFESTVVNNILCHLSENARQLQLTVAYIQIDTTIQQDVTIQQNEIFLFPSQRFAELMARVFLSREKREDFLGNLLEDYATESNRYGMRTAQCLYWKRVLGSLVPLFSNWIVRGAFLAKFWDLVRHYIPL